MGVDEALDGYFSVPFPTFDLSPLFDSAYYLRCNPDLVASRTNPLHHFLLFGAAEGRDPHPGFSSALYWERLADAGFGAVESESALEDFLSQGWARGVSALSDTELPSRPRVSAALSRATGGRFGRRWSERLAVALAQSAEAVRGRGQAELTGLPQPSIGEAPSPPARGPRRSEPKAIERWGSGGLDWLRPQIESCARFEPHLHRLGRLDDLSVVEFPRGSNMSALIDVDDLFSVSPFSALVMVEEIDGSSPVAMALDSARGHGGNLGLISAKPIPDYARPQGFVCAELAAVGTKEERGEALARIACLVGADRLIVAAGETTDAMATTYSRQLGDLGALEFVVERPTAADPATSPVRFAQTVTDAASLVGLVPDPRWVPAARGVGWLGPNDRLPTTDDLDEASRLVEAGGFERLDILGMWSKPEGWHTAVNRSLRFLGPYGPQVPPETPPMLLATDWSDGRAFRAAMFARAGFDVVAVDVEIPKALRGENIRVVTTEELAAGADRRPPARSDSPLEQITPAEIVHPGADPISAEPLQPERAHLDLSVVVNLHDESELCRPTLASVSAAVHAAGEIRGEVIVVLDSADDETVEIALEFAHALTRWETRVVEVDVGELAAARNAGVDHARGRFVCFVDGDDLISPNWLSKAYKAADAEPRTLWHPALNVVFGGPTPYLFVHADSRADAFDPLFLLVENYWSALVFGARDDFRRYRFQSNSAEHGWGYEDWSFNAATLAVGIEHGVVEGTAHFVRLRPESMARSMRDTDALPRLRGLGAPMWRARLERRSGLIS